MAASDLHRLQAGAGSFVTQKTYELVLRLLSPDPKIRELAADEFNDRGWNQDDELLLGRVLVRAALAENVPRCLEAQLNALGGNERGSIGLPQFDHSVELAELIDRPRRRGLP